MLSQTLFGVAAFAGVVATSSMPRAPDPCQVATQELEEAEARFWRWCANHSSQYGACIAGRGRGPELTQAIEVAKARRARECT